MGWRRQGNLMETLAPRPCGQVLDPGYRLDRKNPEGVELNARFPVEEAGPDHLLGVRALFRPDQGGFQTKDAVGSGDLAPGGQGNETGPMRPFLQPGGMGSGPACPQGGMFFVKMGGVEPEAGLLVERPGFIKQAAFAQDADDFPRRQ